MFSGGLLRPRAHGIETPAKLNLFLEVLGRRPDGYHEIVTLMIAVGLWDALRIAPAPGPEDVLAVRGHPVPTGPENLVLRAVAEVRRTAPVPPLAIELHKRIPCGAGLGGGSGNAAGMLAWLMRTLGPGAFDAQACAARLGSDVPFFLGAGAAIARGRGERIEPFPGVLFGGEQPWLTLLLPPVHATTAAVYQQLGYANTPTATPADLDVQRFATRRAWIDGLHNRLEAPAVALLPVLGLVREWLSEAAPGRWRMSGSGASFYAVSFSARAAQGLARAARDRFGFPCQVVRPVLPTS